MNGKVINYTPIYHLSFYAQVLYYSTDERLRIDGGILCKQR